VAKQTDAAVSYESSGVRQVRATALGRGTHGVPDVRRMVEDQFHVAFPHRVWVAGKVVLPLGDDGGTLRFTLAAATGESAFVLPCVVPGESLAAVRDLLLRTHDAVLEDVVREGRLARVGGLLRYDAVRNGVTFVVSELDPTPTAAELAETRARAVQAVTEAGLAAPQRAVACRTAPAAVAVVGGEDDVALAGVERELVRSGYGVHVQRLPVVLSGLDAGARLADAVRSAADGHDVVLLVRAEGRPLGLAHYDAPEVAAAVADAPVPVVTGLGGAGERTAADEVAHASLPTATAAAHWVVHRLQAAERSLGELAGEVERAADDAALRCRRLLEDTGAEVERAADEAAVRSAQARARARRRLLVVCAVVAALVVGGSAVAREPWWLLALLAPAAVLVGVSWWWTRAGGGRRMAQREDDFAGVVARLQAVRDELAGTSSPERVAALRDDAGGLVARGRELLGTHLPPVRAEEPATAAVEPVPDVEAGPGAGWVQPDAATGELPAADEPADPAAPSSDAREPAAT
jgi:exodeoxyribonuclease VII large subunit